jgi:hypothetical protein
MEYGRFLEEALVERTARKMIAAQFDVLLDNRVLWRTGGSSWKGKMGSYPIEVKFIDSFAKRYGEEAFDALLFSKDRVGDVWKAVTRDVHDWAASLPTDRYNHIVSLIDKVSSRTPYDRWEVLGKGGMDKLFYAMKMNNYHDVWEVLTRGTVAK